jgi:hypothetical protein
MLSKMVIIETLFMSLEGTAVSSVMVLQNSMDLPNNERGSSIELCVTSALDGNEVIGVEAGRLSDVSEVGGQETTIPAIKAEPNVSCVPVVSVTHISYRLCTELPAPISVCPCETNI